MFQEEYMMPHISSFNICREVSLIPKLIMIQFSDLYVCIIPAVIDFKLKTTSNFIPLQCLV